MSTSEDIGGSTKQSVSNLETSEIGGISKVSNPISNFEAIIEDIDKAINMEIHNSNPTKKVDDIVDKENSNLEKCGVVELGLDEKDIHDKGQAKIQDGLVGGFVVGWLEPKLSNKEGKAGRRKITKCDKGVEAATKGPNSISELKKGCWTKRTSQPMQDETDKVMEGEMGLKCKVEKVDSRGGGNHDKEKRLKTEEETKKQSMLFATHLGLVEVAGQPYQVQ